MILIYLDSKYFMNNPINHILFKINNFYMNNKLVLDFEYKYKDAYNDEYILYEYSDSKNRKVKITVNCSNNMIETVYIYVGETIEYKFTNAIGPYPQYKIDDINTYLLFTNL